MAGIGAVALVGRVFGQVDGFCVGISPIFYEGLSWFYLFFEFLSNWRKVAIVKGFWGCSCNLWKGR
jgi:hypothetical protein